MLHRLLVILSVCYITIAFFSVQIVSAQIAFAQEEKQNTNTGNNTRNNTATKTTTKTENKTKTNNNTYQRSNLTIDGPLPLIEQQASDIEHYLPGSEIKKLLVGPDDLITLMKTSTTSNSKGVVIFLPDWLQSATSSKAINFLRNTLPDHGWTTLSIHPPQKPTNYPSVSEKNTQRVEENKKSLQEYKDKLSQIMISVMETMQNYPGIFIMVAEGENAAILIDLYQNNQQAQIPLPSAFILLSAHMLTVEDNTVLAQNLANSELPILDLFLRLDHPETIYNATLRQSFANKQMKVFYRQKQLINSSPGYYPQQQLLPEINGWLKSIGW